MFCGFNGDKMSNKKDCIKLHSLIRLGHRINLPEDTKLQMRGNILGTVIAAHENSYPNRIPSCSSATCLSYPDCGFLVCVQWLEDNCVYEGWIDWMDILSIECLPENIDVKALIKDTFDVD